MDIADLYILIETHSKMPCILMVLGDWPYLHVSYIKISTKRNIYRKVYNVCSVDIISQPAFIVD